MPDMLTGEETLAVASCPHCGESWSIDIAEAVAAGDTFAIDQPYDEVRRHIGSITVELR